jgi:signal transduction histidine kinase
VKQVHVPDSPTHTDVTLFASVVADIARALESPHDTESRISHVLELVRSVVPCDRCALYSRAICGELCLVPADATHELMPLRAFLRALLEFLDGDGERPRWSGSTSHLAMPVIGHDTVLGVLFVDRARDGEYEAHHLRLLAAVCSQLGAYLMMGKLHEETSQQTKLLMDREQQLQGTARFREEFIGVVGHDLRNPLSAIQTGARLLVQRAALDERDRAVAERLVGSADRMGRMIDQLLDFARGRLGGGIPLRRTLVDLPALCNEVVEEARAAHRRTISIDTQGTPRGHWDADRLAQVVSNLVANACQHSPDGTLVRVTLRDEQAHAVIAVNNVSDPIRAEDLAGMFEPFRRGRQSESAGLGLGLYIVERIVNAHGGSITVASTAIEGTTFEVHLPHRRISDRDGTERRPVPAE